MKIGIVVPHIFMHRDILPHVIFSPAKLALDLAEGLAAQGQEVTLFSPGPVDTSVRNVTADLSLFEHELALRGDTYTELLKKHPFTFITLARQMQSELIAKAYQMANDGSLDIVHIYTNEEDTALPFAALCNKPVVFTHHDPFNFLVKYKNLFPKYKHLNWISMSYAQRKGMPDGTNWVGNVYHGLSEPKLRPVKVPARDYVAYLGRIIQPKGVHLAIQAILKYNQEHSDVPLRLKIAGKHYAGHKKDTYWQEQVEPHVDGEVIQYVGFINDPAAKREFLGNAKALVVPSLFDEPFGLVSIEAMACGTPVVGLDSGAIPEVIDDKTTGYVVAKAMSENIVNEPATVHALVRNLERIEAIDRAVCRRTYESKFTIDQMIAGHLEVYARLT
ncbi:MAG TPA: glycosyltransferase [Candidatus Saccharimonadales bacterium]|nr:glycosyltransferase [Candidatus Saccharimonadales bacterium]